MAIISNKDAQESRYHKQQVLSENTLRPENIAVLYCVGDSNSVSTKDYYIAARQIPAANVIGYNWASIWSTSESAITEAETWTFIDAIYPQLRDHQNTITTIVLCGDWPYEVTNFAIAGTVSFQHVLSYMGQIHDEFRGNEAIYKSAGVWQVTPELLASSYSGPLSDLYGRWSLDNTTVFQKLGDSQTGNYGNIAIPQDTRIPFLPTYKKKRLWYGVFNLSGPTSTAQSAVSSSVASESAFNDFGRVLISGANTGGSVNYNHSFIDDASLFGFQDSGINWYDTEIPAYSESNTDTYFNRGEFFNPAVYYAATAKESTVGMCQKTGVTGWVDVSAEAAVGLRLVGEYAYYGESCPCETTGDYNYRNGAICLFGQSSPAGGDFAATPGWESGVPTLIDVTDKQALKSAILADYNASHNPDLTSITSYFTSYSNTDCTVAGRTRAVMGIIYNNTATSATVSIASNVITMKVNGSTVHTISAGKTYKQIYEDVLAYGTGWSCYLWSNSGTPNRVVSAIRSGASVAIGCSHEPTDYHDVEGVGVGSLLYGGGCIGDWLLTQLPISHNWFAYGDPLTRPITPKYFVKPAYATNQFSIAGTPPNESSFSISASTQHWLGLSLTTDFSFSDLKTFLFYDYKMDDGVWVIHNNTSAASVSYPPESIPGQKWQLRFYEHTPYGDFDYKYHTVGYTIPGVATLADFPEVTVSNIQSTQVQLNWSGLPDPLTWSTWYLLAYLPTDDINGPPQGVILGVSSSNPSQINGLIDYLSPTTTYHLYQVVQTRKGQSDKEYLLSFTTA